MSLATRCTACGTVFRVVQDQLRVSNGWVRCGRCGEVFNAVESLVDLELDRPGDGAPPSAHGTRVLDELARVAGTAAAAPPAAESPPPDAVPPPAAEFGALRADDAAPGELRADDTPAAAADDLRADPDAAAPPAPGFVRQADRAARWRQPPVRAGLAALALAAAGGLAWQVHLSHHDWIAARWPALAPAVQQLCTLTDCEVEAPRRIEGLAVESSGLVRAGAAGTYRLSVVLRNRDRLPLRVPAVDLTLTDAQGRMLARRVLLPAELGATAAAVGAGADLVLSTALRTRDAPVVGYTIEIFYP